MLEVEGPVIIMEQVPMVGVGLVGTIMLKTSVALNLCEKCARHKVKDSIFNLPVNTICKP